MKKLFILFLSAIFLTGCSAKSIVSNTDATLTNLVESKDLVNTEDSAVSGELESGGYTKCAIHTESYHSINFVFADYVGLENYNKWTASLGDYHVAKNASDVCSIKWNIVDLIKHFDISKEDFSEIYYNNSCYYHKIYDLDILYCGDEKTIDKYFRNVDYSESEKAWRSSEYEFKRILLDIIDTEDLKNGITPGDVNIRQVSIVELVNKSGISREEAEKNLPEV